jgi:hypothetical protein
MIIHRHPQRIFQVFFGFWEKRGIERGRGGGLLAGGGEEVLVVEKQKPRESSRGLKAVRLNCQMKQELLRNRIIQITEPKIYQTAERGSPFFPIDLQLFLRSHPFA